MPPEFTDIYNDIFAEIARATHVMLCMHRKPDGDTAGSSLAMSHYLESINKPHTVFCIDPLSPSLHFLPGHEKITTNPEVWHTENATLDLVIVFDSGDLKYNGSDQYIAQNKHRIRIINIDHHITNTHFGDVNLVIPASSTCEIVHGLLESVGGLTRTIGTCLMTGLVTDTGGFTNLGTTASSIDTASHLLQRGVNLKSITKQTLQNRSVATLRLWGRALERLTTHESGIITTVITHADMQECNATYNASAATEGIANFLNTLEHTNDAKAVMVLSEPEYGLVKGSLRSTHPLIDVSKLAILLGGGGHKKAAGFSVRGHLEFTNGRWNITPVIT